MHPTQRNALREALTAAATRRGIVGGLIGGLLLPGPIAETEAERRGKRKHRKRKRKRNKRGDGPETRIGAVCPAIANNEFAQSSGDLRLAQTFTADRSGPVIRTEVLLRRDGDAERDFIVQLATVDDAGVPTNGVLAEATVAGAAVSEAGAPISVAFADPPLLVAGTIYALVLTRPEAEFVTAAFREDNGCNGRLFFSINGSEPFELASAQTDLIFTAFVRS